MLRGAHQALRSGGISGRGQGQNHRPRACGSWQGICSVRGPIHISCQGHTLRPPVTIFSLMFYSRSSFHLELVSRSHAKHRALAGNYSWVFICWLVWLVFISTKISPDSSPRTRISILVRSQAAPATASKGPEENSSFQSHCPQAMALRDRSIAHTADCWTWGDCVQLSFSASIKKECHYHASWSWSIWETQLLSLPFPKEQMNGLVSPCSRGPSAQVGNSALACVCFRPCVPRQLLLAGFSNCSPPAFKTVSSSI